jgi:hypothetical protein
MLTSDRVIDLAFNVILRARLISFGSGPNNFFNIQNTYFEQDLMTVISTNAAVRAAIEFLSYREQLHSLFGSASDQWDSLVYSSATAHFRQPSRQLRSLLPLIRISARYISRGKNTVRTVLAILF